MTIGIIGLGLLGSAIAERFVSAGYTVCGYDADPSRCSASDTAQDAAGSPIVLLCLPDSGVTARVLERKRTVPFQLSNLPEVPWSISSGAI